MYKYTTLIATLATAGLLGGGCFEAGGDSPAEGETETGGSETGGDPSSDPTLDPSGEEGEESGEETTGGPSGDAAMLRVVHGSPDGGPVDIYVEGIDEPVIAGLTYGETTPYLDLDEGEYNFQVRAAGSSPFDEPAYETGALLLPGGATVTALAAGLLGSENGSDRFRVLPLVEDFEQAGAGEALVRIVHAGADAPAVDIDVGDDGTAELTEVERFADSGSTGVALPADTALQVAILAGGERVTAFTTPALPEGAELFVVATGLLDRLPRESDGFSLLAVSPEGSIGFIDQNPIVYALHAGPDAPEVDLCVGDTEIARHITYGTLQSAQVPPGSYTVDIFAAPSNCQGTPVESVDLPDVQGGERYLAVATGELSPAAGEPPIQVTTYSERFRLDAEEDAVFRLLHAASAPEVDVGVVTGGVIENGNLLAEGLKWPSESAELRVAPITYQVGLAGAGSPTPIHPIATFHVATEPGFRGFVIAAGDLSPESTEQPFGLLAVDTAASPWTIAGIAPN